MNRARIGAIVDGDREATIDLIVELIESNRRLEARVAGLEERLNRSSRNSGLPSSADPPSAPGRPAKRGSGRKPGGQSGHPGSTRLLVGPERVDEVFEHWPARCRSCDRVFEPGDRVELVTPGQLQVAELPALAVSVTVFLSKSHAQFPPEPSIPYW